VNLLQLWLVGWVLCSILLVIGANAIMPHWSTETKQNFSFKAPLAAIVLWPIFIIMFVGMIIAPFFKRRLL
jgi:hypothetical protein